MFESYPPMSEASREVANLTERKNQHAPVYGIKEFVCLSVMWTWLKRISTASRRIVALQQLEWQSSLLWQEFLTRKICSIGEPWSKLSIWCRQHKPPIEEINYHPTPRRQCGSDKNLATGHSLLCPRKSKKLPTFNGRM